MIFISSSYHTDKTGIKTCIWIGLFILVPKASSVCFSWKPQSLESMDCCSTCVPVWCWAQQTDSELSSNTKISCWIDLALWYQVEYKGGPCPVQEQQNRWYFLLPWSLRPAKCQIPSCRNKELSLVGFILALYDKKQVARFKCAFVVYTSCLDIQNQMAVYHSQVNSLTFWGLWCVLMVIFCTVWSCYFFDNCLLRGTRITSTSTTWLSLMFVLWEIQKRMRAQ